MSWVHEHLGWTIALVWLEGFIASYIWLLHADRDPKLSPDTRLPPVLELAFALVWFITMPMIITSKVVFGIQALVAKFKS